MTREEAAKQYARAISDLITRIVLNDDREDVELAQEELAAAILVLTDPAATARAFLDAPFPAAMTGGVVSGLATPQGFEGVAGIGRVLPEDSAGR